MRITVFTNAVVSARMAAPGIRAYNIARVLQQQLPGAEVTLAIAPSTPCDLDSIETPFRIARPGATEMRRLAQTSDVVVAAKFPLKLLPSVTNTRVVLDMYTPYYTEMLEVSKSAARPGVRNAWLEPRRKNVLLQLALADLVLCANDRQRDLYAGMMATLGLVSARVYDSDTSLRHVLEVAPYGIRPRAVPSRGGVKGVFPGLGKDDKLLLWNGTIIEWYDAESLIRAVHRLSLERSDVKLVFLGTDHPDSFDAPRYQGIGGGAVRSAVDLASELGVLDKQVFFNFGWADNETTEHFLADADIGVATYYDSLETRYSYRVRFFDLLWAGLPIVVTRGDIVSEMVERRGLGLTVPERDVDALTAALRRLVVDDDLRACSRKNMEAMRGDYSWEQTLRPLIDYCRDGATRPAHRRERWLPIARLGADWLASQATLLARYQLPAQIRARVATKTGARS